MVWIEDAPILDCWMHIEPRIVLKHTHYLTSTMTSRTRMNPRLVLGSSTKRAKHFLHLLSYKRHVRRSVWREDTAAQRSAHQPQRGAKRSAVGWMRVLCRIFDFKVASCSCRNKLVPTLTEAICRHPN